MADESAVFALLDGLLDTLIDVRDVSAFLDRVSRLRASTFPTEGDRIRVLLGQVRYLTPARLDLARLPLHTFCCGRARHYFVMPSIALSESEREENASQSRDSDDGACCAVDFHKSN